MPSATVTGGIGSERHNHELGYRATLEHVVVNPDDLVELVEYRPYKEQINELMKPYIDDFNAHAEERYQDAWERYRAGERKSKPKRREFPKMGYDYYEDHKDDLIFIPNINRKVVRPIFRSLIIGIGDQSDRQQGRITREQAEEIFRKFLDEFREKFPELHVLGATIHFDEAGFYHMHLDYKPVMDMDAEKGLQCTTSLDTVLEQMGYQPEQSIINGRDKAPIRFNAFRNEMYHILERQMNDVGLRLEYGVSKVKEPGKDSSRNQSLKNWQDTQDAAIDMQHTKNNILDIIEKDDILPEEIKKVTSLWEHLMDTVKKALTTSKQRVLKKDEGIVSYSILDQLQSFANTFYEAIAAMYTRLKNSVPKEQYEAAAAFDTPENRELVAFCKYNDAKNSKNWIDFQNDREYYLKTEGVDIVDLASGRKADQEATIDGQLENTRQRAQDGPGSRQERRWELDKG